MPRLTKKESHGIDRKKFALATFAGGIVFFVSGFVFYGLLLQDFMVAAYADGALKETPEWGILILADLIFGAFLTMVLRRWPDAGTVAEGAKAGAVLTLLLGLGFSLVTYATTNTIGAAVIPVEVVVSAIRGALAGGAIGAVLGRP